MNGMNWKRGISGLGLALACLLLVACAPGEGDSLGLQLRFAQLEQAQIAESGLPAEVQSIQVRVRRYDGDGAVLAESGCLDVSGDAVQREHLELDLEPEVVRVEVTAYGDRACALNAEWFGASGRVVVSEGEESPVAIYVTRRGLSLNPVRSLLPRGRAFATATAMADGRVLIAGGFSSLQQEDGGGPAELSAACDALVYDPGKAEFESGFISMNNCRGLHQAMAMADGSVWIVGGASRATLDPMGATRPILRPSSQDLVLSIERFDPQRRRFEVLDSDVRLARAMAASAPNANGGLMLFGGRTGELRSRDILSMSLVGDTLALSSVGEGLAEARSGALAVPMGDSWLVVGGQASGGSFLERLDGESLVAQVLDMGDLAGEWSLSGHDLTAVQQAGQDMWIVSGGQPATASADPSALGLVIGDAGDGSLSLSPLNFLHARAYHRAFVVQSLQDSGLEGMVLAGGLGEGSLGRHDLEFMDESGIAQALEDELSVGALGMAAAALPDGSVLLLGGVDVAQDGTIGLSQEAELLSP